LTQQKSLNRRPGRIIPWLFHRDGKPIKDFRWVWASACKNAGVPGRIPHDFRRTAVRNLERAGVPRSVAMAMVGHRTEAIYRRYAIADEAMLKRRRRPVRGTSRQGSNRGEQGGCPKEGWGMRVSIKTETYILYPALL
jgi:integrase